MLRRDHKQLLLTLARERESALRQAAQLARSILGNAHPRHGELQAEVERVDGLVRALEAEPERAAA